MAKIKLAQATLGHQNKNVTTIKLTIHIVKKSLCLDAILSDRVLSALTSNFAAMDKDTINSLMSFCTSVSEIVMWYFKRRILCISCYTFFIHPPPKPVWPPQTGNWNSGVLHKETESGMRYTWRKCKSYWELVFLCAFSKNCMKN